MVERRTPPTCEIVTIGSELLLGQILDTNTAYLAQELNKIGIAVRFRTSVGDEMDEIVENLQHAVRRCDMVITTGGIGPTLDDLTREAVARVAGVDLEYRQELMDQIEQVFRRSVYQMSENNRRQAFVPRGSLAIHNPVGTAPGFIKDVDDKPILCLPGVPRELKYLVPREVLPWLRGRFDLGESRLIYKVLKTAGIGESKVDTLIGDLMGSGKNPEVGLLASMGEIKIRIAASARDAFDAEVIIRPVEEEIRLRLGDKIFGQDDETLEGVVESLLSKKGLTLALMETFTGGLMSLKLCSLPSRRLVESHIIPDKSGLERWFGGPCDEMDFSVARTLAQKIRETSKAHVGLVVLGPPEKGEGGYAVKGRAVALGAGIDHEFSWEMGGDVDTLQQRGAIIGLNTLRLALMTP